MEADKNSVEASDHQWEKGDLGEYLLDGEIVRVLLLPGGYWVNERGNVGILNKARTPVRFIRETDLVYVFRSPGTVEADFDSGTFDKYFE